ncbi:response regulator transcription factor [Sphingomonas sp.]|uniref:response regulator transcription factor n=1 Tax=Sphingomonas sp. TaxID=28214 RepID=UPI001ECC47AD|nr:response regulator transcription factor [Sphingomonas sp.]MBX3594876.1 response regulator transcription factor [Sphingomonas sp.]
MGATPIRLLIVDDHLMVRQGIRQLLCVAPDVEIVGEADSGEAALSMCATMSPHIVLMDLRMPGMGGLAATEAIRRAYPDIRIIGLSTFAEGHMVNTMIANGARAHLPKSVTFDELIEAIRKVRDGSVLAAPTGPAASAAGGDRAASITGQQRRVLALMVKGFTNPEIATYLGLSVSTANYHVGAILAKLGVSNRAEAVAIAVREQMTDEFDL